MVRTLWIVGLLGMLSACGPTETLAVNSDGTSFESPADGTALSMRTDVYYTMSLESNPTTGYIWVCESGNDKIVSLVVSDYIADPAPEGLVGSGGRQVFTLAANQAGRSKLTCSYQRSPGDVADRRDFILVVG